LVEQISTLIDINAHLSITSQAVFNGLIDKNIADISLNSIAIAAGVACVAVSVAYTALMWVPGAGAFAVAMTALSIAADVINFVFVGFQTDQIIEESLAFNKFKTN
jgi:hypothetical protein